MGQPRRSAVTLGFYGEDLDPDELTSLLGATPAVGVAIGETWLTSQNAEKKAPTGSWRIETGPCEPEDLSRQIEALLSPLTANLTVWRELTRRFRGVVFCGLWMKSYNDGLQLSAKALGLLAERGLLLDLDIYTAKD